MLLKQFKKMDPIARETLLGLYKHGPCYDGDAVSKSGRTWLVQHGFAVKVVVKGKDGYNACTYKGRDALKLIKAGVGYIACSAR